MQENILKPGSRNADLEEVLMTYPEKVGKALLNWEKAELDRETIEGKLHLRFKAEDRTRTAGDLKALISQEKEWYEAYLLEISCKSTYTAINETLLSMKRLAGLREAF